VCRVDGVEVNRWLVEQGWALAYVQYGGSVYLEAQRQAQAAKRGIWQGRFQEPWAYRRSPANPPSVYYRSCAEAKTAGAAPLHRGQPGYRPELDRDGDGVACER